jgi:glycosyltransferase involved in cell wall biosynthesis
VTPASFEIFVPFWGDPDLLVATVESVLAQNDTDWKLVVVDDAYPDAAVSGYFSSLDDTRIRYIRNPENLGISGNFARCLDLASGELMMFLGCDDLLHPDFVSTVRAALARFPNAAMVEVGVRVIDDRGGSVNPLADRVKRALMPRVDTCTEFGGETLAVSLLRGNWLYWPSLVFRTDRAQRHRFRQDLPIILDLALIMDMVIAGDTLVLDPTVCFSYRRHRGSLSSTSRLQYRLPDERRYYDSVARQLSRRGWNRAARTAQIRWTSRLHALSLVPHAVRVGSGLSGLLTHALRPPSVLR